MDNAIINELRHLRKDALQFVDRIDEILTKPEQQASIAAPGTRIKQKSNRKQDYRTKILTKQHGNRK